MIVVKVGGRTLDNFPSIAKDLVRHQPFVLVHGGGDLVTEYSKRMGVEPKIVVSPSGIRSRYTDEDELEVFTMVLAGKVNKELVSTLLDLGIQAVGISGVDGPTLIARRKRRIVILEKGRRRVIPGGYTGKIEEVRVDLISLLLDSGYSAVVAPLARGTEGEMLNVDGDQAASKLSIALEPAYLILLSDVEGVMWEENVVKRLTPVEAEELAAKLGAGMNRKLMMAAEVARSGVRVAISSGLVDEPVTHALNGAGTHVVPS
ncbi:MAG: [LysW]-aminoadipate/[LysW]-glutamate kinase [Candidatus Korarchaeota archaeon]|nr:[LysW]-aminoadipate/[LysW]-glutamate kinase [Candidatus Korarchaeota archaeon]